MAPAFVAGRYDPLAQHGHLAVLDAFDRPHHLADHADAVGDQRTVRLRQRQHARQMSDLERFRRCRFAIDPHRDVRRIADAFAVDENAAETLNDPDNAGAADALIVATRDTRSADTLIAAAAHLCPGGGRSGKPESHKQRPAREDGLPGHDWPPSSASPSAASSGPSL